MFQTKCWYLISSVKNVELLPQDKLLQTFNQWMGEHLEYDLIKQIVKKTLFEFYPDLTRYQLSKFHSETRTTSRDHATQQLQTNSSTSTTDTRGTQSTITLRSYQERALLRNDIIGEIAQFFNDTEFETIKCVNRQFDLDVHDKSTIKSRNTNISKEIKYKHFEDLKFGRADLVSFNNRIYFADSIIFETNLREEMNDFHSLQALSPDKLPTPINDINQISLSSSTIRAISTATTIEFRNDALAVMTVNDLQKIFYKNAVYDQSIKHVVIDVQNKDFSLNNINNSMIKFFKFSNNSNNDIGTNNTNDTNCNKPICVEQYSLRLSSINDENSRTAFTSVVYALFQSKFPQTVATFDMSWFQTYKNDNNTIRYQDIAHFLKKKKVNHIILPRSAQWNLNDVKNVTVTDSCPSIKILTVFASFQGHNGLQLLIPKLSHDNDNDNNGDDEKDSKSVCYCIYN